MALIPCPHCSQTISDRAVACPRCNAALGTHAAVVAESSTGSDATPTSSIQYLAKASALVNRHPWLASLSILGALLVPLLLFVCSRPFDEQSEGALVGFGSLVAMLSIWSGIWLAMPGTTRSQKWRSVAMHVSILLAIAVLLWLLIAVPLSRYLIAAVAVCVTGYIAYRFLRKEITAPNYGAKPPGFYRWGVYAGQLVVFLGAFALSSGDRVLPTNEKHDLRVSVQQQPSTTAYESARNYARIRGIVIILIGLKLAQHFTRKACLAELGIAPNEPPRPNATSQITSPPMTPLAETNPR